MADISDVEAAIGALLGTTLYPAGASGEAASPVAGCPVLIQQGWPDPTGLQTALAGGKVIVTLFPAAHERNTTRYPATRDENPIPATTWTLSQAGQTVTVGGGNTTPWTAQNLCVFAAGKPHVYQPTATDTAASTAAALQALIAADVAGVTVAGAVIAFPPTANIGALRVGAMGSTVREVRRQERQISIITWAPTPALRDAVVKAVDPVLTDVHRVSLPDGQVARLTYVRSVVVDADEKAGIYRRDLIYAAEYGTTITEAAAQIVANQVDETDPEGNLIGTRYS